MSTRAGEPFIIAGVIILAIFVLALGWAYNTGNWGPAQNSDVAEVGICLQDGIYETTPLVPLGIRLLYACGMIEGTTNFVGVLYLYDNVTGKVIESVPVTLPPGVFFYTLSLPNALSAGSYRLEISKEKITREQSTFVVQ